MIAPAFSGAILAFLLFGLSTDRHHRKWLDGPRPRRSIGWLRFGAWSLLAASFVLAMSAWGPVVGAIGWVAAIMAGAVLAFCFLNFVPRR